MCDTESNELERPTKRQRLDKEASTIQETVEDNQDFSEDVDMTSVDKFTLNQDKYQNFVSQEELEKLREFTVLDEVKSNDEDSNDEQSDSSDGKSEGVPEEEIEKMLEEDLPEGFKGAPKPKEKAYITRQKIVLEEKGVNQFEVLPLDWMMVRHYSGVPVYMHRASRVCTLSKPYFLGKGNTRRHDIPISAIPCLAYRKALEEEEKQKEIDRQIQEQIRSGTWQQNLNKSCPNNAKTNVGKELTVECNAKAKKCPFNNANVTDESLTNEVVNETVNINGDSTEENNLETNIGISRQTITNGDDNGSNELATDENSAFNLSDEVKIEIEYIPETNYGSSNENTIQTNNSSSNDNAIETNDSSSNEKAIETNDSSLNDDAIEMNDISSNENAIETNDISSNENTIETIDNPLNENGTSTQTNENHIPSLTNTTEAADNRDVSTAETNENLDVAANENVEIKEDPDKLPEENSTEAQTNDDSRPEIPLNRQPVVLPGGIVMPPPRVETVSTSWKTQHLTHEQVNDYCKKLFKFKTVNIMHFKRWADRRKYTKARKTLQYPALPEGTKLITIPAHSAAHSDAAGGKANKRDWVMNMNGRSYLSVFHEYVRRALQKQPVYEFKQLENASTPYQATVYIGGMQYGVGHGSSKRGAKSAAARASIHILIPEMRAELDAPAAAPEPDFSFFDCVGIEDPRITEFCAATCEPSPHAILRTCLLRNFGAGDNHIHTEMKKLEYQKIELTMSVGKHSATVVCKNKKTAKQRASQAILQALHPHVRSWGSLLRLYGSRSVKSCKEKKLEEQQITLLQDAARQNEPNYAVLEKLRNEMRKLRERDEAVVPIGTLLVKDDLPTHSGSNLNNVDL